MARAENLDDVTKGRQIGKAQAGSDLPARGQGIKADNTTAKPLPDIRETERPSGYVGQRRRGGRD